EDVGMSYVPEIFERAAAANPASVAVIEESNRCTFAELADEANRIARVLKESVKGDTVGVLLLNSQRYVATMLGIWKSVKTTITLIYYPPPAKLGFIIKDSGMAAVFSSQFFNQAVAAMKPLFGDKGLILMADDPDFGRGDGSEVPTEYRDPALY